MIPALLTDHSVRVEVWMFSAGMRSRAHPVFEHHPGLVCQGTPAYAVLHLGREFKSVHVEIWRTSSP